jgi:hypothetical protein
LPDFQVWKFIAEGLHALFGMCSSSADEIANIMKVDRVIRNKYKDQVRQLGGVASYDEDIA